MDGFIDTFQAAKLKLKGKRKAGTKIGTSLVMRWASERNDCVEFLTCYHVKDAAEATPFMRLFSNDAFVFERNITHQSLSTMLPRYLGMQYRVANMEGTLDKSVLHRGAVYKYGRVLTPHVPATRRDESKRTEFEAAKRKFVVFVRTLIAFNAFSDPAFYCKDMWNSPYLMYHYNPPAVKEQREENLKNFCKAFMSGEVNEDFTKTIVHTANFYASRRGGTDIIKYLSETVADAIGYSLTPEQWINLNHPELDLDQLWETGRME